MTNPNMHTEGIDADGEVEDCVISTYYNPCKGIVDSNGYLRVFQDGDCCDYETRIDHAVLIAAGWNHTNEVRLAALAEVAAALSELPDHAGLLMAHRILATNTPDGVHRGSLINSSNAEAAR